MVESVCVDVWWKRGKMGKRVRGRVRKRGMGGLEAEGKELGSVG